MEKKTALVFGATGLVGNLLLEELTRTGIYASVRIFVRQATGIAEAGVEEIVTDFGNLETVSGKIAGDDLYICLGTTIKKAGSVSNMEKIDRDLPVSVAERAFRNGTTGVAVVSSVGARRNSSNYYLRIKGEMEGKIINLGFPRTVIVRPSLLLGERKEIRAGELISKAFMKTVNPVMMGKLKKYRAIHGKDVARAMIFLLQEEPGVKIAESDELQVLAKNRPA